MLRYGLSLLMPRPAPGGFPVATLLVNLLGCLMIGLLAGLSERSGWISQTGWPLLAIGLCGGFTTFSALALEDMRLLQEGALATAVWYTIISVTGGILLCRTGYALSAFSN